MKVLYDVSVLGPGHVDPVNRTGIFRAVEQVARGLAASGDCELTFSAFSSIRELNSCLKYLEVTPELQDVPILAPSVGKGAVRGLSARIARIDSRTDAGLRSTVVRKLLSRAIRLIDIGFHRPKLADLQGTDIFHSTYFPLPARSGGARSPKRFLTVHDLIPVRFPHFFGDHVVRGMESILRSLRPGDWVVCNSQATKNDLCDYLGFDPAHVFVTPFAAAPEMFHPVADPASIASVRSEYGIPDDVPYVLSLNTLEPRKNMDHAIRSFVRLVQEERIADLHFVLVGAKGWQYDRILEAVSEAGAVRERIVFTGYVADEDLAALYSGALAFVYPSIYEGFGFPPLEAMQCGVPVITSNTSSLPEVVGDAGIMLDPTDSDGLSQSMLDLYRAPSLREQMRAKSLARASEFSWERCTQETIAAYKTALAS
jgi:glycosyltransferase involved in cell wall biosynthesis